MRLRTPISALLSLALLPAAPKKATRPGASGASPCSRTSDDWPHPVSVDAVAALTSWSQGWKMCPESEPDEGSGHVLVLLGCFDRTTDAVTLEAEVQEEGSRGSSFPAADLGLVRLVVSPRAGSELSGSLVRRAPEPPNSPHVGDLL